MKFATLPCLLSAFSLLLLASPAMTQDVLWQTLYDAGEKSAQAGDYAQAERQLKGALAEAETQKKDDERVLTTVRNLAAVYIQMGKYAEAQPLFQRLLTADATLLGDKHPDVAMDHAQLATVYARLEKLEQAQSHYMQAVAILQKADTGQEAHLSAILTNLAVLYENQGQFEAAEPLLKQALKLGENSTVKDKNAPPSQAAALAVATSLDNLSRLYATQNRFAEAEPLFKRALTIRVNTLGPVNLEVANSLTNLGKTYQQQGKFSEAESLLQRAVSVIEESKGRDNQPYALALTSLARLHEEQRKLPSAQKLYEQALVIQEKVVGRDSAVVADTLNGLASALSEQYDYTAAEPLYQRALRIDELIYGKENPAITRDLNNLALLYLDQGKYAAAEPLYKRALAIAQTRPGPPHPDLASCLNNLAFLYKNQGQYVQAEELLQQALTIREKLFGKKDRLVAQNLSNLASVYQAQGKYNLAEPLLQRALEIDQPILGNDHAHVAVILRDMAQNYQQQKKYPEAEHTLRQLLDRDERLLGTNNPVVASDLDSLAQLLSLSGNKSESTTLRQRARAIKAKLPGYLVSSTGSQLKVADPAAKYPIKNKWALIVGVSNFKDPSINLKYAAKDAADFRSYLISDAHFAADHIKLLTDKDATREGIIAAMGEQWLKRVADPDDLIVVYVSSHGTPSKKEIGGTNFIVPYEANIDNIVLTGIPMQWLTVGLKEMLHCRRLVLIMDLCHSGAAASADRDNLSSESDAELDSGAKGLRRVDGINMSKMTLGSGQIVITSSGSDQISWESAHYPNSVFTRQLIQGLKVKGDRTTLAEAYEYMSKQVEEEVLRDRAQIQTPVLMTQEWDENDVILGISPSQPSTSATEKHPITNLKPYKRGKK